MNKKTEEELEIIRRKKLNEEYDKNVDIAEDFKVVGKKYSELRKQILNFFKIFFPLHNPKGFHVDVLPENWVIVIDDYDFEMVRGLFLEPARIASFTYSIGEYINGFFYKYL